ncbi:MAG TPA: 3'-5' exonuclease [Bacteroidales bacterium]|nr:3'-5' exonuclease [Bacteroidales bacterium]HPI85269.1 3'-5' exonuclease [Bacteroidales bacterium]HPM92638.1 3'-5' exonuclease [Bacteroidales bacterium]
MESLLKDLNEPQKNAVINYEGPSMVLAGAGSGKTRVLTYRVAYLVHKGIDPFHILALTFTNKAAREMKERITSLVGADARNVWMGTFHSIFSRLLRIDGYRLGYTPQFTIYDTEDSKRTIRNIVKEMDLDPKVYQPGYILHRISSAKTRMMSAREYFDDPEIKAADQSSGKPHIGQIFLSYAERLKKSDAMDFDDLLVNMNILLEHYPEVLLKYQRKFEYILVDEYQDTNYCQYLILKHLAANNENICVVGDDAQSIYAFRGASIQNILNFRHDYPDHRIFKLEQNYRSTQNIVNAANSIIINNKDQIEKKIWTQNDTGPKIRLIRAKSDTEEGTLVVNAIFELKMNKQLGNDAFAVLYRTNAQSRSFEESLRKLNIPYRIYGSVSFYQRKEIKDLLAYFRLAINNRDEDALIRVINYPARGIGQTTMEKIIVTAGQHQVSSWQVIENPDYYQLAVNSSTRHKLEEFVVMIKSFSARMKAKDAYDLARTVATTSGILKDLYEDQTPEGVSRFENVEELLNAIREFCDTPRPEPVMIEDDTPLPDLPAFRTLDEFMQDVALITDADDKDPSDRNHVSLMTIHAAKGLEFPHIFISGLEENLFPSIQSLNSRADLEEERRLFYVALTRGMHSVTVSYAENRYRWGNLEPCDPSRFIDEIDPKYIEIPRKTSMYDLPVDFRKIRGADSRETAPGKTDPPRKLKKLTNFTNYSSGDSGKQDELSGLQPGMMVEHEKFGKGKVQSVEGEGSNKKAVIFFQLIGQKQLLLKFAKLKIL